MEKLAIWGGSKTIETEEARFIWPHITPEVEKAVLKQLRSEISIYTKSGIFAEFERRFAEYHGVEHSLLSNSGTSAIFSMFEGIGLQPGDEVICPSYTFFATASPLIYLGAIPIFCDCTDDGNIDPNEIYQRITSKTVAVIVTHMWGIPCEMDEIVNICQKYKLSLLEDCSHAHGALYKGKKVGSFGDAAAWSIQGQKLISGGEGGIMLTDNNEIFYRALLQGHYNKRCKQQIPMNYPLYKFALTGFGLKFRAHPLAIALANEQLNHLDEWIEQKEKYVAFWKNQFNSYKFLRMPSYPNRQPSWYAFVMRFNEHCSNGVKIEQFIKALHAEGLIEVDHPGSTKPIHEEPLFCEPNVVMQRLYQKPIKQNNSFKKATSFYANAIKLPVWAYADDYYVVEKYAEGFHKVCQIVQENPELLTSII